MSENNTGLVNKIITGIAGIFIGAVGMGIYKGSSSSTDLTLTSDQDKQSYSLGVAIGAQTIPTLNYSKNTVDLDYFLQGYKDKITEQEVKLSDDDIRQYIQQLQQRTASKLKTDLEQKAIENQADLFANADTPSFGDGTITIVEFFDYNCPHCRSLNTDLKNLVKDNQDVKVLYRPVGIVMPSSQQAVLAVLAANKQNKFKEVHNALMEVDGAVTQEVLDKIIKDLKLDEEQFKKDLVSDEVAGIAEQNRKVFLQLGLRGVPSLFAAKLQEDNSVNSDSLVYLSGANTKALSEAIAKFK